MCSGGRRLEERRRKTSASSERTEVGAYELLKLRLECGAVGELVFFFKQRTEYEIHQ